MVFTDSATSAPIPSPGHKREPWFKPQRKFLIIPGIKVTVYLPPYFVGLKISDWTVAMAAIAGKLNANEPNDWIEHTPCSDERPRAI
jgi:hypothetical protein